MALLTLHLLHLREGGAGDASRVMAPYDSSGQSRDDLPVLVFIEGRQRKGANIPCRAQRKDRFGCGLTVGRFNTAEEIDFALDYLTRKIAECRGALRTRRA